MDGVAYSSVPVHKPCYCTLSCLSAYARHPIEKNTLERQQKKLPAGSFRKPLKSPGRYTIKF
ncbi:hypothetical protein SAMN02799630_00482 [Paenibacillus sp. UNCCL117]|nr:hypothetical protein SAMN04488602_10250 [Paenibacillus sp. cl123]SFW14297.1 hypothetical protein SAMN02799630_00482 [Paenibacillus sp. UNCCL117]